MEDSPYSPEHEPQLEDIEFYKQWIRDCFDPEYQNKDMLHDLYKKISAVDLTFGSQRYFDFFDLDTREFIEAKTALEGRIAERLDEQLNETVEDLQRNVFDTNLFSVHVVVNGGEKHKVEKVVAFQGRVMPIVYDNPYHWPIERIEFS